MNLKDLLPSDDVDELFTLLDSKDHWLLLIVDFLPVTAIIGALSKMMAHPPRSFRVTGLPPVIALPKKDISTKALAGIMSTAAGGPIPEELIQRMIGDRSVILCAEPKSLQLGIESMERFMKLHREWKTERYGIQLFFITNRLYKEDYESAMDFLAWLLAGVVCYTANDKYKTDVEIVTNIAEQVWHGATGGGKEKADKTAKAIKDQTPHMEESLKVLDGVAQDLEAKDRAICVLHQWMRADVLPSECAQWAASNMGLCLTLLGGDLNGQIAEVSEKILVRIRDRTFATNLWVKQRTSVPLEKLGRPLDERQKIEPDKD
jgi:hypothetical protein